MTAAARVRAPHSPPTALVDPVVVFKARAEARAMLWVAGELDLHEAVDKLQADAVRDGLVEQIGQDALQNIIAEAFRNVRGES